MIISFIGPDGVGKTTHAKGLVRELRGRRIPTVYVHLLSSNGSFLRTLLSRTSGMKKKEGVSSNIVNHVCNTISLRDSKLGYVWQIVRVFILMLDSWLTYLFILRKLSSKKGLVIVYDRYFYDVLASICYVNIKLLPLVSSAMRIMPEPNLVILLTAEPSTIALRKREDYVLQHPSLLCMLYKILGKVIRAIVINTEESEENSQRKLFAILQGLLMH